MKSLVRIIMLICCICCLDACKEEQQGGSIPDTIFEYTVTPIHGGANISYSLPTDRDILYVMAEYERNGERFTERSSFYKNSITVEGFNTLDPVIVTLYTVNRNGTRSAPVRVDFVPLESIVSLARKSTQIIPSFGGLIVSWENITKTELGVRLMVDSTGTLIEKEMYYSSQLSENHPFRGFESVETSFVMTFEDKWGNVSDTVYYIGTPLFEIEVPKPWTDLRELIPYDNTSEEGSAYNFTKIWDNGIDGSTRYLSGPDGTGCSFTFDLGSVVKLSRMAMWPFVERGRGIPEGVYGQVHILEFEMWGTKKIDPSRLPPADPTYWLHPFSAAQTSQMLPAYTFMDDWEYLGRYAVTRLDFTEASQEDIFSAVEAGHHFDIPLECEPVRIIRFFPIAVMNGSPPPNSYWQIAELSFWGDTTIPQD